MTVKKPTGSAQSGQQENKGSAILDVLAQRREKLSPYQRDALQSIADEGRFDQTNAAETAMAAEIVYQVYPKEEPALVIPDFPVPTPEERKAQEEYYRRQNCLNIAAQVYSGSVPLGEAGKRVGEVIVEAAQVIESYLSGNKADGNQD